MIALPLAKKIAELFLILFAAAALVKTGILKAENSKILSKLSLYFVTPCVVFNSFQKELTDEIGQGLLVAVALATGFELLFFLIAAVLRRVWKATEVERASVIFSNVGNLVIPLVSFVLGQEWVIYTSAYIFVFNLLFWTVGIRMFDRESAPGIRKILLNPNLLATWAGLITLFTRLKLPERPAEHDDHRHDDRRDDVPQHVLQPPCVRCHLLPHDSRVRPGRFRGRTRGPVPSGRQEYCNDHAARRNCADGFQHQPGGHSVQQGGRICFGDQRSDHSVLYRDDTALVYALRIAHRVMKEGLWGLPVQLPVISFSCHG